MNYPTGKTHLLMLIADPVAHVRAAQFVNPIFEKKGLDAFLVPIHVRAADLSRCRPPPRQARQRQGPDRHHPAQGDAWRDSAPSSGRTPRWSAPSTSCASRQAGGWSARCSTAKGLLATAQGQRHRLQGSSRADPRRRRRRSRRRLRHGPGRCGRDRHPQSHGGAGRAAGRRYQGAISQGEPSRPPPRTHATSISSSTAPRSGCTQATRRRSISPR